MPPRTRVPDDPAETDELEPSTETPDSVDEGEPQPGDDALERAVSELGLEGRGTVRILKYDQSNPGKTGWAMVCKVPASEFDPYDLGPVYGHGLYRFQFVDEYGRIRRSLQRQILAPIGAAGSNPLRGTAPGMPANAMEQLRDSHQKFLEQLVLTLLGGISQGGGGGNAGDLIKAFQAGREAATQTAPAMPHTEVFDAIKMGVELAGVKENGGGDPMNHLLPKALEMVSKVIERSSAIPPARPQPKAALPEGQQGTPAAHGDVTVLDILRHYVPHILQAAQANRDPHVWGQWVADNTPAHLRKTLLELAGMEQAERHAMLSQIETRLIPYLGWTDSACEGIADLLLADPETDDDDVSPGHVQPSAAAEGGARDSA